MHQMNYDDESASSSEESAGPHPPIIVMTGPSGVGKSTLIKRLCSEYPTHFELVVSHTSRKPRANEVDGRDYHFVSEQAMVEARRGDQLLEWAMVHGCTYGTSRVELHRVFERLGKGGAPVLDLDPTGARSIHHWWRKHYAPLFIFVRPPSLVELRHRLEKRGTESVAEISERYKASAEVLEAGREEHWNAVLTNDSLDHCYAHLVLVLKQHGLLPGQ
jgi:guanylate kinase